MGLLPIHAGKVLCGQGFGVRRHEGFSQSRLDPGQFSHLRITGKMFRKGLCEARRIGVQSPCAWRRNITAGRLENIGARETWVSQTFDPSQVVQTVNGWNENGEHINGRLMTDGSYFFDANKNGVFDTWMKDDIEGNTWMNNGSGWVQVSGGG